MASLRLGAALRHVVPAAFVLLLAVAIPLNFWPVTRTHAFVGFPTPTLAAVRSGDFTRDLEHALRETSRLAVELRGMYAETAFRFGLLDSDTVAFGRDGWMFLRESLTVDAASLARAAPARAAFLSGVRATAQRLGVSILCLPVPDKERVYPGPIYPGGTMPADRAAVYPAMLDELRAAGLETIDVLAVIEGVRRADPATPLYHARDTHWTVDAAAAVALAVKARLDALGWAQELGPPVAYHPSPMYSMPVAGDLVAQLGFRVWGGLGGLDYLEHRFFGLALPGRNDFPVDQPEARLALCGTSFSNVHLGEALAAATLVLVDRSGVRVGGGPFEGLRETLAAVERGAKRARVVVWEFVERTWMHEWQAPPAW